jgi:hypothetical protein
VDTFCAPSSFNSNIYIDRRVEEQRRGASRLFAQAGEGGLVLGVDGGSVLTARRLRVGVAATVAAAEVASSAALTTTLTTLTAAPTTRTTTTAAAAAASGALGLNESRVKVNGLLDLALALALLLADRRGKVDLVLLGLVEGLGVSPFLVELAALVGLTDLEAGVKGCLLLGLLSQVVLVRDALILRFGGLFGDRCSIFCGGLLLLGLSNSLTGLLVLQLGITLSSTPRLGSLLLRATASVVLA